MNNDLISKSALQAMHKEECGGECGCCLYQTNDLGCRLIDNAPVVDAEPVRHGWWNPYKQNVECSECHVKWAVDESIAVVYTSIKDMKYCPNCGAKMDGDVNA